MLTLLLGIACRNKDTPVDSGFIDDSEPVEIVDNDSDGSPEDEDCDDFNNTVKPGNTEVPYNGQDDDCDESTPDDDLDGDGYLEEDDCNDLDAEVNPGATETCNGLDDDCSGEIDDAVGDLWYVDADGDGYGDPDAESQSCDGEEGTVADSTDCDDTDGGVYPGASEECNEIDDNCDGTVDEGVQTTFYVDADGDGSGSADLTTEACDTPTGYADDDTDCDDGDASISPNATEICDGVDNDCDGDADTGAVDATTWYRDSDSDSYGDATSSVDSCEQPSGYVDDSDDCDDTDADVSPDGEEVCNDIDDDCDGDVDEGSASSSTWYADSDGDGYGDSGTSTEACDQPSGYVENSDDCDDTDADAYTGATEVCDGSDNDCDGTVDNDEEVLGDEDCSALSCDDVLDSRSGASDGNYWIDPDATGTAFEVFCDMSSEGGGWTLVANIDDVNDPWLLAQDATWESTTLRNETTFPSYSTDIAVTTKYESWTTIEVTDVYVYYKNDGAYFLCEGLDVNDTLSNVFSTTPSASYCASNCTSWSEDRLTQATMDPVGLNCSDPNEGWMSSTSYTTAENARIGGQSSWSTCCVMNAWAGAAGDRGFDTSEYNKTWGDYNDGEVADDNILVFVR